MFAPWGAKVGETWTQATTPPNAANPAPTTDSHVDAIADGFMGGTGGPSNEGSRHGCRITDFCVEITCDNPLASIGSTLRVYRHTGAGLAQLSLASAGNFKDLFDSGYEVIESKPRSFAEFTNTKCITTGMRERTALEFASVGANNDGLATAWAERYAFGVQGGNSAVNLAGGGPYAIIIITVTGPTLPSYYITVKGTLEVSPVPTVALYRLARFPPLAKPGDEEKWWALQRKLITAPLQSVDRTGARNISGYVGITQHNKQPKKKPAPKAKQAPRRPKPNTTTTTTTRDIVSAVGQQVARHTANAVAGQVVRQAVGYAARAAGRMGRMGPRRRQEL